MHHLHWDNESRHWIETEYQEMTQKSRYKVCSLISSQRQADIAVRSHSTLRYSKDHEFGFTSPEQERNPHKRSSWGTVFITVCLHIIHKKIKSKCPSQAVWSDAHCVPLWQDAASTKAGGWVWKPAPACQQPVSEDRIAVQLHPYTGRNCSD